MRAAIAALGCAAALLGLAAPAQGAFGLNDFDVFFSREAASGAAATEAGSHPFAMRTSFGINFSGVGKDAQPDGEIKDATFEQVAGLVINPLATPRCETAEFLKIECPAATQVGETTVEAEGPGATGSADVFNLLPPPGSAARLGFVLDGVPVVIDGNVKPTPPFNLRGVLSNTRQVLKVFGAELTLFGTPGEVPFLTLPSSCTGPARSSYEVLSWQGETDSGSALTHDAAGNPQGFTACEKLIFNPRVSSQPTTESAASASGLVFELRFDQTGLLSPEAGARAQSTVKDAVVTLPEGVTANPSIAEGLGVCSEGDLDDETLAAGPGEGCPDASKIGTVEVQTPLLEEELPGSVYIAEPHENPFDSLIAFYIVIKDPLRGVLVKLPAKVEPDPETGRLVTTVENAPQFPFSRFTFRFREGQRAPLITPPTCGTYTTRARFTPWSRPGESVSAPATFRIAAGPGGGPCPPGGARPFAPGFQAGSASNAAGHFSPFLMRLTRQDGHQDLTRFDAILPRGVVAKLAGVSRCTDAQLARARSKSGREELASPSCPPNTAIGRVQAGAGTGSQLTYVGGAIYLAGPFGGAPLSAVAIVPAVAGPFDVGTVVYRQALRIDPRTAEVRADGAFSDPLPHILAGIPLAVRDVQVFVERPGFTLNPTSCEPKATIAGIWGGGAHPFSLADDAPAILPARYQAASCEALGFAPRLGLRLRGGTRRGAFPALRAVYRPRSGHANLSRLALRFPRSAFVEQGHFRTICTRVQYAANACPKGSIYGRARAFTPLLAQPLEGPVYLRSSNNNLPDAVFALKGIVDVEAVVRIDSVRGALRATVLSAPDVPVSRVIVNMQGGQKGLIVNSRNLCRRGKDRANVRLIAHNAKRRTLRPVVRPQCGKPRKAKRTSHRGPGR